jgi:hypothetical protein
MGQKANHLFLFGASGDAPHEQYILSLNEPVVRYRPWKFRNEEELLQHRQATGNWFVRIPGYRILLDIEFLSKVPGHHSWRHIPVIKVNNGHWDWLVPETEQAANFYLTKKIIPNEPKFNRYKDTDETGTGDHGCNA